MKVIKESNINSYLSEQLKVSEPTIRFDSKCSSFCLAKINEIASNLLQSNDINDISNILDEETLTQNLNKSVDAEKERLRNRYGVVLGKIFEVFSSIFGPISKTHDLVVKHQILLKQNAKAAQHQRVKGNQPTSYGAEAKLILSNDDETPLIGSK